MDGFYCRWMLPSYLVPDRCRIWTPGGAAIAHVELEVNVVPGFTNFFLGLCQLTTPREHEQLETVRLDVSIGQ